MSDHHAADPPTTLRIGVKLAAVLDQLREPPARSVDKPPVRLPLALHDRDWFHARIRRIRVLDLDAGMASVWAAFLAPLQSEGLPMPIPASLLAASAPMHRLTVVTRNVRDFQKSRVNVLNLF